MNSLRMRRMQQGILWFILLAACSSAWAQGDYPGAKPWSVWEQSRQMQLDYVEHLKKQLAADPDNVALQLDLGRAYTRLAMEREGSAQFEAEKIFEQMLTRHPANAVALAYHGSLLGLKIGFNLVPTEQIASVMKQTFEELDRAVTLAPDSIEVRVLHGYGSFYTPSFWGRDALAVEDFTHAIKLLERWPQTEGQRAQLYLILGDTYSKMGDRTNARACWQRVAQLLPGSSAALGAEARLRSLAPQDSAASLSAKVLIPFLGFLIGAVIFGILTTLVLRDLVQARRRRSGMVASLFVSLAALVWNGLNLWLVVLNAIGIEPVDQFRRVTAWHRQDVYLALALSPIPFGLLIVYRFYKATFMDIVLKRGAALLAILIVFLVYARLVEMPLRRLILHVSNPTQRSLFYTLPWLFVIALYLPLRNRIYRLVDRYLFKRRDYSGLLDWFSDRVRSVTDEASLIAAMSDALKEAFAADSVRFVPATDGLATRLSEGLSRGESDVALRQRIRNSELEAELEKHHVELVLGIRSGHELLGIILIGPRAYGQGYLSEELSVLRAVAAQIGRTLENLRLHEARRQQAIAEEELRKLATQAELKALRAQIDPHFFFNALNSVASLIPGDPEAAEGLLEDLAELFRHAFKPNREFLSLEQELELVETYLKVEKVRLGDKLQFKKVVTPEALPVKIPALTIQPLIENAVRHGIGRTNRGGSITLSATARNGRLSVAVADTGVGIPPSELSLIFSRGVGLANINNRLIGLYGQEAQLQVDSFPEQGTTVSFTIPLAEQTSDVRPQASDLDRVFGLMSEV